MSNFLQSGQKILVDLINSANGTALPETALTFAAPTVVSGKASSVVATATTGSGYSGNRTFKYNRVDLGFMLTNEPGLMVETTAARVHDLIPYLNSTFGIQMTAADIVDGPVPTTQPDVISHIDVVATAGSLVWFGQVSLPITKPLTTLDTVLTVTTLDGLYPPLPL